MGTLPVKGLPGAAGVQARLEAGLVSLQEHECLHHANSYDCSQQQNPSGCCIQLLVFFAGYL